MSTNADIISLVLLCILGISHSAGNKNDPGKIPLSRDFCKAPNLQSKLPGNLSSLAEAIKKHGSYLARGGFGKVYKVPMLTDDPFERQKTYAVKVVNFSAAEVNDPGNDPMAEIDILLQLREIDRVPKIYRCELYNDQIYIMQTYLHQALYPKKVTDRLAALPLDKRASLLRDVLLTLDQVHKVGYIHGDIKLENLMLESETSDVIYVIDFGLARRKKTYKMNGTWELMSPEIVIGRDKYAIDEMDDVWAFALSIVDIELRTDINLSDDYKKALMMISVGIDDPQRKYEMMEKCIGALQDLIEEKMNLQRARIGRGCPASSFQIYKNAVRFALLRNKRERLDLAGLVRMLEKVREDCVGEYTDTLMSEIQEGIINKITHKPIVVKSPVERFKEIANEGDSILDSIGAFFGGIVDAAKGFWDMLTDDRETFIYDPAAIEGIKANLTEKINTGQPLVPNTNDHNGLGPVPNNDPAQVREPPLTRRIGRKKIFSDELREDPQENSKPLNNIATHKEDHLPANNLHYQKNYADQIPTGQGTYEHPTESRITFGNTNSQPIGNIGFEIMPKRKYTLGQLLAEKRAEKNQHGSNPLGYQNTNEVDTFNQPFIHQATDHNTNMAQNPRSPRIIFDTPDKFEPDRRIGTKNSAVLYKQAKINEQMAATENIESIRRIDTKNPLMLNDQQGKFIGQPAAEKRHPNIRLADQPEFLNQRFPEITSGQYQNNSTALHRSQTNPIHVNSLGGSIGMNPLMHQSNGVPRQFRYMI
jgi:serine/threonine protein kinase